MTVPLIRPLAQVGARRGWARRRRGVALPVAAIGLLAALIATLPLVYLFVRSLEDGWGAYAEAVTSPLILRLLARTLSLVVGVLALALIVAVPLAWLVVRTDLPARRAWAVTGALPLAFPSYVAAFAWVAALGPRGYAQGWLAPLGVTRLPELAYGYSGALLVLGLFTYPYIFLLAVAGLRQVDPALEECSRGLGAGRWRTFFRVVLPQLRPALYSGSLLVVLYTLSDFGAVSIVRYNTFTLSIYNAYRSLLDRRVAASLATVLVLVTLVFIALEAALLRRTRAGRTRPSRPPEPIPLGRWKAPAIVAVGALATLTLGVPLGVVLFWGARGLVVGNPLGGAALAAIHSLGVSGLAAAVTVGLSLPVAVWAVRYPGVVSRAVSRLCQAGYALPGIVIGLALVFLVSRYGGPLYQTLAVLVLAYVVRFLPQALAATRASIAAIAPGFEEAARSLGRRPLEVLRSVVLPLIRPGLLAGAGLVFLTAMKELPATLILRPTGFETLATKIWSAAAEGIFSQAALPALALLAVSAAPVYLLVIRPALRSRV